MGQELIRLKGISKSYGKNQVLKSVDMTVNKGDIYGLIGKNGAGKTTLFKVILGLTAYQSGEMSIFGGKNEAENRSNRKRIGFFVGASFFGYLTGRENLDYYRRVKDVKDKGEINRVLDIVGLTEKQSKAIVSSYSLGMKQRLGIANALLGRPELLIFDEPTNGLDPQGIHDIRMLIQSINKEDGTTIIVSSHILSELEHTAHRFGIVHNGVIMREITREEMNIQNKTVSIEVTDDNSDKAKAVLEQSGIKILNISRKNSSLEEFYFGLIGGENNV